MFIMDAFYVFYVIKLNKGNKISLFNMILIGRESCLTLSLLVRSFNPNLQFTN